MAHGDFKDLNIRTAANKVLRDKAFNFAKNPRYDGYERELASMVYKFFYKVINYKFFQKFFDKKTGGAAALARSEILATKNKSAIKNENGSSIRMFLVSRIS